jgi:hypothetical protein
MRIEAAGPLSDDRGMLNNMRYRTRTGLIAALAALTASIAIGTAVAAPIKNAQRTCEKAGGTFATDGSQYTCNGIDPTGMFDFLGSSLRQCVRSYKGVFAVLSADPATGVWRYLCDLP